MLDTPASTTASVTDHTATITEDLANLKVAAKAALASDECTMLTPEEIQAEPLLRANPRRFVILPIQHDAIWKMYKKAEGELAFLPRHQSLAGYFHHPVSFVINSLPCLFARVVVMPWADDSFLLDGRGGGPGS